MRILINRLLCKTKFSVEHLKNHLKFSKNFEQNMKDLDIISLENGRCVAEMTIKKEHSNILGTLHGGFSATLADVVSSYGLSSLEKGLVPHVSLNLNIRYIGSGEMGKRIVIESETIKCGKRIAFLEITIKNKDTGTIIAKAEHTKYLINNS